MFAFDSLDDLSAALKQTLSMNPHNSATLEWSYLVSAGQALTSQHGAAKSIFGAAVRKFNQRLGEVDAGRLVVDHSVDVEMISEVNEYLTHVCSDDTETTYKVNADRS